MSLVHVRKELRETAEEMNRTEMDTVSRMEVWEKEDVDAVLRRMGVMTPGTPGEVLMEAARLDLPNLLTYSIRNGFLHYRSKLGDTAFHTAAKYGHPRIISLLLSHDFPPSALNRLGETPLMFACDHGSLPVIRLLIPYSDTSTVNIFHQTALHYAVRGGNESACEEILKAGKGVVNVKDQNGMTALDYAAEMGETEIMGLLEKYGGKTGFQREVLEG